MKDVPKKEHDFLFAMVRCGELPCTISNVAKDFEEEGKLYFTNKSAADP